MTGRRGRKPEILHAGSSSLAGFTTTGTTPAENQLLGMYMTEVGRYPLLDKANEIELGQQMEAAWVDVGLAVARHPRALALLQTFLGEAQHEIKPHARRDLAIQISAPGLNREDFSKITSAVIVDAAKAEIKKDNRNCRENLRTIACARRIRRAQDKLDTARNTLVKSNLRLVIAVARRYANFGLSLLDLIQEGNVGLLKAIDRFDYRKGFKFSTYATWWIRQAVSRGLADKGTLIRLPVHMHEARNRLIKTQRAEYQKLQREPSPTELADAADMTLQKVQQIRNELPTVKSMHAPIQGDDEAHILSNTLQDPDAPTAEDMAIQAARAKALKRALSQLPNREATVLQMRYGLGESKEHSLSTIAAHLGISRQRVHQIECAALKLIAESESGEILEELS